MFLKFCLTDLVTESFACVVIRNIFGIRHLLSHQVLFSRELQNHEQRLKIRDNLSETRFLALLTCANMNMRQTLILYQSPLAR